MAILHVLWLKYVGTHRAAGRVTLRGRARHSFLAEFEELIESTASALSSFGDSDEDVASLLGETIINTARTREFVAVSHSTHAKTHRHRHTHTQIYMLTSTHMVQ